MRSCLAVAALALVLVATTAAEARHRKHHKPAARAGQAVDLWRSAGPGFARQEPARMIEVRPGLYISSYGCIQDEGYGRYSSCDVTDGNR